MIDKTTAAKYEVTWGMQPHMVSAGAQKNFMAFADLVAKKWESLRTAFNELYWKQLVAKGILSSASDPRSPRPSGTRRATWPTT